jgi:DNA (cytosine-5)-methyltransferase 1
MLRIIKEIRPNWIVNENVEGSVSNGILLKKLNDLENENYKCQAFSIPAFAVGAWHFRQRVFIIANSNINRFQRREKPGEIKENEQEQLKRFYKIHTFNSDSEPKKKISSIREKWETWKTITGQFGRKISRTYWEISEPPIPGVDDGIPNRVDRTKALGNAVVPQQIVPIFKAIVQIESEA